MPTQFGGWKNNVLQSNRTDMKRQENIIVRVYLGITIKDQSFSHKKFLLAKRAIVWEVFSGSEIDPYLFSTPLSRGVNEYVTLQRWLIIPLSIEITFASIPKIY